MNFADRRTRSLSGFHHAMADSFSASPEDATLHCFNWSSRDFAKYGQEWPIQVLIARDVMLIL
jgi:hypothetical protein